MLFPSSTNWTTQLYSSSSKEGWKARIYISCKHLKPGHCELPLITDTCPYLQLLGTAASHSCVLEKLYCCHLLWEVLNKTTAAGWNLLNLLWSTKIFIWDLAAEIHILDLASTSTGSIWRSFPLSAVGCLSQNYFQDMEQHLVLGLWTKITAATQPKMLISRGGTLQTLKCLKNCRGSQQPQDCLGCWAWVCPVPHNKSYIC